MIAARQARTAERDPYILHEARLEIDAGREGERVAQADDRLVGIIFISDEIGTAGRLRRPRFGGGGSGGGVVDGRRVGFGHRSDERLAGKEGVSKGDVRGVPW